MKLYFISGNENKVKEVQAIVSKVSSTIEVEQKEIDLPEIQEMKSQEIISTKLDEKKRDKHSFFSGDVSVSIRDLQVYTTFDFDSIFTLKDLDKTFAQMFAEEKNILSHRALAVR